MKAIVMAGGEGTRLRPLTCEQPKPLLSIGNRAVLSRILDLLDQHGFREAIITVRYLWKQIADDVGQEHGRLRISVSRETEVLGTAGSVRLAATGSAGPVLVCSGDALTDFDLTELISRHRAVGAAVTIGLSQADDPSQFGVVITDPDGRITRFQEKPPPGQAFSDQVNTGIYVVEPEVLAMIPQQTEYDFARDLFPRLLAEGRPMYGWADPGYWCDIGDCAQYLQANIDFADGRVRPGGAKVASSARIERGAVIEGPCVIGEHTIIERDAIIGPGATIADGAVIGEGARVQSSVVGPNAIIGPHARLERSITAARALIGAEARLGEGSVIGDRTRIGDHAVVRPQIRVWPDKEVMSGAIIRRDVIRELGHRRAVPVDGAIEGQTGDELGPDTVAAIARTAAFTRAFGHAALVGSAGGTVPREMRLAALAGTVAGGAFVLDAGDVTRPGFASAVRATGAHIGLYITTRGQRDRRLRVEVLDREGRPIERGEDRKLAQSLGGEPPRVRPDDYHAVRPAPGSSDIHVHQIMRLVDADAIRNRRLRAVIAYEREPAGVTLEAITDRLGIDLAAGLAHLKHSHDDHWLTQTIVATGSDFGAWITGDGTGLRFAAGDRIAGRDNLVVTLARILLDTAVRDRLFVPPDASGHCERLAKIKGIPVERVTRPPAGRPEDALWADGFAQLLTVVDYGVKSRLPFDRLLTEGPAVTVRRGHVDCPWEVRAKVLRAISGLDFRQTPAGDGIRLEDERGWAHISPEPTKARIRITCEAENAEIAGELAGDITRIVKRLVSDGSVDANATRNRS